LNAAIPSRPDPYQKVSFSAFSRVPRRSCSSLTLNGYFRRRPHQDGRIDVLDVEHGDRVRSLAYPGAISARLAPSGRRLLVHGSNAELCELISLDDGAVLARFERNDRQTVNASFLVDGAGDDIVLVSRQNMVLEGFRADDAAAVFRIECRRPIAYYFADPVAMLDGDTIMALGHQLSERKDSFYRFSLALCRDDPKTAGRMDPAHTEPSDYAYRVAVGPCGPDALVAFRDARDREVLEEGETYDNLLYGFNGIYVRRLTDCAVVERLAYDAPIETGAPIMGTQDAIVVARGDEVDVIERGMPAPQPTTKSWAARPEVRGGGRVSQRTHLYRREVSARAARRGKPRMLSAGSQLCAARDRGSQITRLAGGYSRYRDRTLWSWNLDRFARCWRWSRSRLWHCWVWDCFRNIKGLRARLMCAHHAGSPA
jgi:hypothetical protein